MKYINKTKTTFFLLRFVIVLFVYLTTVSNIYAAQYDLIAPSGLLNRGQNAQFVIKIDTEGQLLTAAEIGMTYKADILEYVSTTPGDAFLTVDTETQEEGRLVFKASSSDGFSGTGTFATITFKIIADAPGSTDVCVLFNPLSPTPVGPTNPPVPTSLPKSGESSSVVQGVALASLFLLGTVGLIFFNKNEHSARKLRKSHKTLH